MSKDYNISVELSKEDVYGVKNMKGPVAGDAFKLCGDDVGRLQPTPPYNEFTCMSLVQLSACDIPPATAITRKKWEEFAMANGLMEDVYIEWNSISQVWEERPSLDNIINSTPDNCCYLTGMGELGNKRTGVFRTYNAGIDAVSGAMKFNPETKEAYSVSEIIRVSGEYKGVIMKGGLLSVLSERFKLPLDSSLTGTLYKASEQMAIRTIAIRTATQRMLSEDSIRKDFIYPKRAKLAAFIMKCMRDQGVSHI